MSYNKAAEERKWIKWKEREEKILRNLGMGDSSIMALRYADWEMFNSERRFREHQVFTTGLLEQLTVELEEPEIINIQRMIDAIEDENLLRILLDTDKRTLQIILLKIMGYTVTEICQQTGMSGKAVYCRMDRLKKKIKKFLQGEEK